MMPGSFPGALLQPSQFAQALQVLCSLPAEREPGHEHSAPAPSPVSPQPGAVCRDGCFLGEEAGLELIKPRLTEV